MRACVTLLCNVLCVYCVFGCCVRLACGRLACVQASSIKRARQYREKLKKAKGTIYRDAVSTIH